MFLPGWEEGLFPQPAHARRAGPRRPRGGAPPRLCRPHPRAQARQDLLRHQPPHPRPVADHIPSRFLDELPEAQRRGDREQGLVRRLRPRLRRVALRQDDGVRLELLRRPAGSAPRPTRAAAASPRPARRATARRASATTRSTTSQPDLRRRRRPAAPASRDADARRAAPRSSARRSPSRASWWRNRPAPCRIFQRRRPGVSPEVRQRQRHRGRRQQADHRVRQGGREAGGG